MQPEIVFARWNDCTTLLIDIASRNIAHLGPADTLIDAARLTARLGISSLLVLDPTGHLQGIVTEYDLLCAMHRHLPAETPLHEVMTSPVLTVPATINCHDAYRLCLDKDIRHLVVVDPQGLAMAVVSETDFRLHLHLDTLTGQASVATIMNRLVDTLPPDAQLHTALSLMACKSGAAIVVVEGRLPVGILTERDVARLCSRETNVAGICLHDIMSAPVQTVMAVTSLSAAAECMLTAKVRQLPVVDAAGQLLGLLNARGLTRVLAATLIDHSLFQEQERTFSLLEQAPFPVLISGMQDGHIRYCNPRLAELLGVNRDGLLEVPITRFYRNPRLRDTFVAQVKSQGSVADVELQWQNGKGEPIDAIVSSSIIEFRNQPALLSTVIDITRRRQVEEEIERERTKFHTVFRSIPDLVWLKDPNGVYLACNKAFERFIGAPQSVITGGSDYDFVDRALADFFRANDQKAIDAGRPVTNEEWLVFADGSFQGMFETIKTPIFHGDGTILGVLGISRDISERRRTERDLRERIKEQRCLYAVSALVEETGQPLSEQLQLIANQVCLGWQFPDITTVQLECAGLSVTSPHFEATPWMQVVETASKQGQHIRLTVAYREERPQEDEGPFLQEERRLAEAIVSRLAGALDRRHAATLIRERDQLIATMFAQTADAIVLVDQQTLRFVECNEVAHRGLGYTREEFGRLTVADIQADHSATQILNKTIGAVKGETLQFETRHRHKDGSLRDVALTLRPITLNEQRLISAVWQDITEHKAREQKIKENAERLRLQNWLLGQFATAQSAQGAYLVGFAHEVTALLGDVFRIGRVSVWLIDEQTNIPECLVQYDSVSPSHTQQRCLDSETVQFLARSLGTSRSLAIDNVHADDRSQLCCETALVPLGITSLLYCSILSSGHQRGLLCLEHVEHVHAWELDEIAFGCQVADHLGMVLLSQERLAAVRALKESEKRLHGITDSALDAILMIDTSGTISYWNPAAERILGYRAEEAIGQNLHRLLAPHRYHPEHLAAFREFQRTGHGKAVGRTLELAAIRRDGQELTVSLSMSAVMLDGAWHAVGILRDISELKRQQAELRAALAEAAQANREKNDLLAHLEDLVSVRTAELQAVNEEQRAIFEAAATGIVFIKDHRMLRCNRQLELLFGCNPGEFDGLTTRCWYASQAEFQEVGQDVAYQLREVGRHHAERQLVRKDGSRFWARMTAQAIDPHDLSKGLVGMVEDITEEREASEALIRAKEGAEAATRAKSEFLANMSHEIRTPMNAVIGFAHLLRRDPLTPRQSEQLAKLTDASRHLLRIINDIHDISKVEASKMTLEIEDFEPARVVDHVCGIVADRVAAKQLRLHVDLDHIPPMLRGDGARLSQVLLNLVGNAVKFTEQGRVDLIVSMVSEDEAQVRVRFEVRDTGIGMSTEQLERIFVAFEQADSSTTRRFGGTGLGLAISKRLVELMGGTIGAESAPGQGTLFWIELPFARSTRTPAIRLPVETLRNLHALVIDDAEDAREIVAGMLTELGMRSDTAASGEQGLAAVLRADQAGDPYQLLIIDWQLPGLNGTETARQLQQLALSSQPTFLIMTAYGDQLPRDQAEAAGIHRVMAKPVTPSILHDTLCEILQPAFRYEQPDSGVTEELARRRGAHILLVEDNPINQEVGQMLLESMGMQVSLADNGKTAVDMVSAAPFDLVCMDIQMPVMDGLQAARAIRQLPAGQSVPIVAMTANAFSEDREQCLQAGMNAHIAKPIEQGVLEQLLIRWLTVREQAARPAAGVVPVRDTIPLLTRLQGIAGLDAQAGLKRLLGDEGRYLRLLARFVGDYGREGEQLTRLAQEGETDRLRERAHALKGTAGTLGAVRVQQEATTLEILCKTRQNSASIHRQSQHLHQTLAALLAALTPLLPEPAPVQMEAAQEVAAEQLVATLAALTDLLQVGDIAVSDLFAAAKSQLLAAFGPLAQQLEHQIQAFDYLEAMHTIENMQRKARNGK